MILLLATIFKKKWWAFLIVIEIIPTQFGGKVSLKWRKRNRPKDKSQERLTWCGERARSPKHRSVIKNDNTKTGCKKMWKELLFI